MEKSTVIITGGAGYIGSQTILEMLRAGKYSVISIDNFINSSPTTFVRLEDITGKSITNYDIDLCKKEDVRRIFEQTDNIAGVIHFAALKSVPESVQNPLRYYENNLGSLLNVVSCCQDFNIKNFIFSSSCSVYGNIDQLPVNELTPLNDCESPYAHTKFLGEEILRSISKADNRLSSIALRYFNPVGADSSGKNGEDPTGPAENLVPIIAKTALGLLPEVVVFGDDYDTRDGTCVRDYIHVSDIAQAHILALDYLLEGKNANSYDVINLGSGQGVTVLEAINTFKEVAKVDLAYRVGKRRPGDVASIYSNPQKAADLLGWEPKYNLRDMMKSAWDWQLYNSKSPA